MRSLRAVCLLVVLCCAVFPQTATDVGTGAPDNAITQQFVQAYFRNLFYTHVTMPPSTAVHALGTGLVQEFSPSSSSVTGKYALVKDTTADASLASADPVEQMAPAMYTYYTSVGVSNAGFPTIDTESCPALSNPANSCLAQLFDKNYALFVFQAGPLSGQNFSVADPFYTKWSSLGGLTSLGPAVSAQTAVTSSGGSAATLQTFDRGAIFNITSGTFTGRLVAVTQPVYSVYLAAGGYQGQLGFPTNSPILLPNGDTSQSFESGGTIEYNPNTPGAVPFVNLPVAAVSVSPATASIKLNLGQSVTLTASIYDIDSAPVTNRPLVWTTSNGKVVSLQQSGMTVVVTAVGGGTANVTATSGGKTSPAIEFFVTAPCCQIGDGSPTPAIQQAFQQAVARNQLTVNLPAASGVTRVGSGYVQMLQPADPASTATYLIAVSDQSLTGYLVTGAILAAYENLGGPSGPLGYPASDPTAAGRQLFQNGALAGSPIQQVTGNLLAKWAALGYETGVAGPPAGPSTPFLTFRGTRGLAQSFQNALLVSMTSGPQAGKTYFITGLTLAAFTTAGGLSGNLGAPLNDESSSNGLRQQNFEGGSISYAPGAAAATVTQNPRQPLVTASPATVLSGTTVQLAVGGFDAGATIRVSIGGQPDFIVNATTGAYSWTAFVPANAKSGVVTIQAKDVNSGASAQGSYTITPVSVARLQLAILHGDAQMGVPGAELTQPLVVALADSTGNPAAGVTVQFAASPGAQIVAGASTITDSNGQAQATLRLPLAEGLALATATAGQQVVTFSARAARTRLTNFPALTQTSSAKFGNGSDTLTAKGALITAVASILLYHQNRAELPQPNGPASTASLNQFLAQFCVIDTQGAQICDGFVTPQNSQEQIVNLWRVGAFVGGNVSVSVVTPALPAIRDLIAQGAPVLLALSLSSGNTPLGAHFVVAMGVGPDGSILIADPNPAFGRANLNDYLIGFKAGSQTVSGTLAAAIRLIPQAPVSSGFLVVSGSPVVLTSPAGACATLAQWPNVAAAGAPLAQVPGLIGFLGCDGTQPLYQLDINSSAINSSTVWAASFTDLGSPGYRANLSGSGTSSFIATKQQQWNVSPLAVSVSAGGVVNAASFTPDVAVGGLAAVYGSGFVQGGTPVSMQVNGEAATVIAATPFQANFQIPLDAAPGPGTLQISSPAGSTSQTLALLASAPEIFTLSASQAAILNQDGSLNTTANPGLRGNVIVIFCTGLGAVSQPQGGAASAIQTVTAVLGGAELPVAYAGLTPGFVGLYQVNLPVPAATPPDLSLPLFLKEAGGTSKAVMVAIQ